MRSLGKAEWYEESIVCEKCSEILLYKNEDKQYHYLTRLYEKASIICVICGQENYIPVDLR